MSGIKRTPLDAVFSDLIRERSDWQCEVCGKQFPDRKGAGLHASHFFGRRGLSTRHHGDNVFAHCYGCHQKLGSRPHDFANWVVERIGTDRYDEIVLLANTPVKRPKHELKEMQKYFKERLSEMRKQRADGVQGVIEFKNWGEL